jgi:hypothetical protein
MTCSTAFLPTKLLVLSSLLLVSLAWAAPLQTGEALPQMLLKDQHEQALAIGADTRIIFFAAEMNASKMMTKAPATLPPTALRDRKAIYIADISSMPEPISSIVGMPRMKKLPYTVAVVRYAKDVAHLPRKAGAVTVMSTTGGRMSAVSFAETPEQISTYLK